MQRGVAMLVVFLRSRGGSVRLFRRWRGGIFSRGDQFTARYGVTALMFACEKGDIECARLLVEKGADVNTKDLRSAASCVFLVTR